MATGATTIGLQQVQHSQLSEQIHKDLGLIEKNIVTLQNQLNSLAAVVLQNRSGLELITSEKGGICVFLGEEYCFMQTSQGQWEKCTPITREN
jgi:hypothetical protein